MQKLIWLDEYLFEHILLFAGDPILLEIAEYLVHPEKYFFVFLGLFAFALYLNKIESLWVLATLVVLLAINDFLVNIIKYVVARPRPGMAMGMYWQEAAYSFPSAHSANSMAMAAFFLRYVAHRQIYPAWGFLALVYSLCLGIMRIIANYHFPLDILCGFLWGWGIGNLGFKFYVIVRSYTCGYFP
ncbi:MAG: phosphatase PAP2 family protein [Leptospiraceae bacterium]|nr:phosphatase PAP2 family protein [Leptospiraceae bacterium]MDW8306187.1 phosphatase PAP2 family protein [Leptospiraceae bacterium]